MPAIHPTEPIATLLRTAGVGHEEQYPRPRLSGRCRFGEATFAGAVANQKDAPTPAVRGAAIEPPESTQTGRSGRAKASGAIAPNCNLRLRLGSTLPLAVFAANGKNRSTSF